jgi:hypothetical protein
MPISVSNTAGGTAYGDIRVGEGHGIHQVKLNATNLAASRDADGYLPVGLPVKIDGNPISGASQAVYGFVGPEAVKLGSADIFGNVILSGPLNKDMIEDNLGRVLSANELAGIPAAFVLVD